MMLSELKVIMKLSIIFMYFAMHVNVMQSPIYIPFVGRFAYQ